MIKVVSGTVSHLVPSLLDHRAVEWGYGGNSSCCNVLIFRTIILEIYNCGHALIGAQIFVFPLNLWMQELFECFINLNDEVVSLLKEPMPGFKPFMKKLEADYFERLERRKKIWEEKIKNKLWVKKIGTKERIVLMYYL